MQGCSVIRQDSLSSKNSTDNSTITGENKNLPQDRGEQNETKGKTHFTVSKICSHNL